MHTGPWVIVRNESQWYKAFDYARGSYQYDLLRGFENLSGSTLKGRASSYMRHYKMSQQNLLQRLQDNGIVVSEERGPKNQRYLVIG